VNRRFSRQELFHGLFDQLRQTAERAVKPTPEPECPLLRPPGALFPDPAYLAACTGCEKCVTACPPRALFMAAVDGRPVAVLSPARQPCLLCDGLPCIAACPDGALAPLAAPRHVRIGVALVDPRRCVTFAGRACDACLAACPLPDVAIRQIHGRPMVIPDGCTGCGLCEAACPERPRAITVVAERELIPGVRLPKIGPRVG
jgi:ferredoxin-type protein NapG